MQITGSLIFPLPLKSSVFLKNVKLLVAWLDPVQNNDTAPLALPAEQARVYDIVGLVTVVHDLDDGNDDGHVSVQVTGRPMYVEIVLP